MQIKLTPYQAEKFETIKWLVDPLGDRGTGRTQLLAMAYLHHAMKHNINIPIVNHGLLHPLNQKELLSRITVLAEQFPKFTLKIRHGSGIQIDIRMEPIIQDSYRFNPYLKG